MRNCKHKFLSIYKVIFSKITSGCRRYLKASKWKVKLLKTWRPIEGFYWRFCISLEYCGWKSKAWTGQRKRADVSREYVRPKLWFYWALKVVHFLACMVLIEGSTLSAESTFTTLNVKTEPRCLIPWYTEQKMSFRSCSRSRGNHETSERLFLKL